MTQWSRKTLLQRFQSRGPLESVPLINFKASIKNSSQDLPGSRGLQLSWFYKQTEPWILKSDIEVQISSMFQISRTTSEREALL